MSASLAATALATRSAPGPVSDPPPWTRAAKPTDPTKLPINEAHQHGGAVDRSDAAGHEALHHHHHVAGEELGAGEDDEGEGDAEHGALHELRPRRLGREQRPADAGEQDDGDADEARRRARSSQVARERPARRRPCRRPLARRRSSIGFGDGDGHQVFSGVGVGIDGSVDGVGLGFGAGLPARSSTAATWAAMASWPTRATVSPRPLAGVAQRLPGTDDRLDRGRDDARSRPGRRPSPSEGVGAAQAGTEVEVVAVAGLARRRAPSTRPARCRPAWCWAHELGQPLTCTRSAELRPRPGLSRQRVARHRARS